MYIQNNLQKNRVHLVFHIFTLFFLLLQGDFSYILSFGAAVIKSPFSLMLILVLILGYEERGQTKQWEANCNSMNSK